MQRIVAGIGAVVMGALAIAVARSVGGGAVGSAVVVGGLLVVALLADRPRAARGPRRHPPYTADEAHASMKGQGSREYPYLEVDAVRKACSRVAPLLTPANYRPASPDDI